MLHLDQNSICQCLKLQNVIFEGSIDAFSALVLYINQEVVTFSKQKDTYGFKVFAMGTKENCY